MFLPLLPFVLAISGQAPPPQPPPQEVRPAIQVPAPAQRPVRKLYNETADARTQIADAIKAAADDGIRVLINWGANDDENCTKFQQAMSAGMPPQKMSDEYKVVMVDVAHLDRNQDVAATFKTSLEAGALPHLTILDKSGKIIAQQSSRAFGGGGSMPTPFDPKKIAEFLTEHQAAAAPAAEPIFRAAIEKGKREGKTIFVWFSAPW
jgi:hypothetical protein